MTIWVCKQVHRVYRCGVGRRTEAFAEKVVILWYTCPTFPWWGDTHSSLYCRSVCSLLECGVNLSILPLWHFMTKILFCVKLQRISSKEQVKLFIYNSINWLGT